MTIAKPANYNQLSAIGKAIVDDHIRAGIQPPPMTPAPKYPPCVPLTREQHEALANSLPEG